MARDDLYSKTVVWVKVTLPIIALALLSTLFLFASAPDPDAALPFADLDIDEITREQTVTEPRFAGLIGEGRELIMVAETVSSTGGSMDQLSGFDLDGHMDLSATTEDVVFLQAARGQFDMIGQRALLMDGVTMQSTTGYTLESLGMDVAMNQVDMRSTAPVEINGPGLHLTADHMEMSDDGSGAITHFTGSVRLLYQPEN